jgi:hypothetical protein
MRGKSDKKEVMAVRIDQSMREEIGATGKTATELITSGLIDQIKAHKHLAFEAIYKRNLEQGWLRQADWKFLSNEIYQAFECRGLSHSGFRIQQLLDVHGAFANLVQHAIQDKSGHLPYYLGNFGLHTGQQTKRALIAAIDKSRQEMEAWQHRERWQSRPFPELLGRNLYVALRDETMEQADINGALNPYWATIWHVVAAKHYYDVNASINVPIKENWAPLNHHTDPLEEGGLVVTVWTLNDQPDIQINIIFERQNVFWYPNRYPEIEELQGALSSVPKEIKLEHRYKEIWRGPAYKVSMGESKVDKRQNNIVLNIRRANLNLYLEQEEWTSLARLLGRALAWSDIPERVEALKLRYGSIF